MAVESESSDFEYFRKNAGNYICFSIMINQDVEKANKTVMKKLRRVLNVRF